jgi:hypothetical protein
VHNRAAGHTYVAMYKGENQSALISSIVMLAQECCDFTRAFRLENRQAVFLPNSTFGPA